MSLVEATIILMVLAILTSVAAPSIGDYVNDARDTKVKEDVEALGTGVMRLLRDSKLPCLTLVASTGCTLTNRADLLSSDGSEPTVAAGMAYTLENAAMSGTTNVNWLGAAAAEVAQVDTFTDQLITNVPNYDDPTANYTSGGPIAGIGWRGAYIAAAGADPWGRMYQANTAFLGVANNVTGEDEGESSGGWRHDAFVISAGRNGAIETVFANDAGEGGTTVGGDDIVYVMQGSTR